jgi:hypothetical protein
MPGSSLGPSARSGGETGVSRRRVSRTLVAALVAAGLAPGVHVAVASAQDAPVRLRGRVQWIAGSTLVVAPDGDNPSVRVDLSQVSQDQYLGLTEGDPVAVVGTVPSERDRVVATAVERLRP